MVLAYERHYYTIIMVDVLSDCIFNFSLESSTDLKSLASVAKGGLFDVSLRQAQETIETLKKQLAEAEVSRLDTVQKKDMEPVKRKLVLIPFFRLYQICSVREI